MALTGLGLVEFAKSKIGTAYVYGMKGEVLTLERFNELQNLYGEEMVWNSDINKVGQVCVDCSGLISWYTGVGYNAAGHKENAIKVEPISTLSTAPLGAILWQSGHVGVYAGIENGKAICYEAKGSAFGTVKSNVEGRGFTHWLLMDYITYSYEETTEVKTINVAINGLVKQVSTVTVDGNNYVKLQDLNNTTLGISYNEMPIISINDNQIEVKINGESKQVSAINVEGNNYIKLQDLNGAVIKIGYDEMPIINTDNNVRDIYIIEKVKPQTTRVFAGFKQGDTINIRMIQDFLINIFKVAGITAIPLTTKMSDTLYRFGVRISTSTGVYLLCNTSNIYFKPINETQTFEDAWTSTSIPSQYWEVSTNGKYDAGHGAPIGIKIDSNKEYYCDVTFYENVGEMKYCFLDAYSPYVDIPQLSVFKSPRYFAYIDMASANKEYNGSISYTDCVTNINLSTPFFFSINEINEKFSDKYQVNKAKFNNVENENILISSTNLEANSFYDVYNIYTGEKQCRIYTLSTRGYVIV